jgi:hypothetical protein
MPIVYTLNHARQRLFSVAEVSMTYPEVVAHLKKERDNNCLPLAELIDATQVTVALSAGEVHEVAQLLQDLGCHNTIGPMAIVTGDDISYGMVRMLEILLEDVYHVRPFRDRVKAEEWLNTISVPCTPVQEGMNLTGLTLRPSGSGETAKD